MRLWFRKKQSPLKSELENLRRRIIIDDNRLQEMSDDFWKNGGICCPGCGVPGYLDLQEKQDRRRLRVIGIEKKLAGGHG